MWVDSIPNSEYYTAHCLVNYEPDNYKYVDVAGMFMITSAHGHLNKFNLLK